MDRLLGMEVFVAVVETGSMAAAAEHLKMSGPMVGKHVRALEKRLGASVLARTTRRQKLTEAGHGFYWRCKAILEEVRLAESSVEALRTVPRGRLRVSAPVSFGTVCIAPSLVDYMARYPDLSVELNLGDELVDLVEDGFDAAIRIGALPDSGLVARKLAPYEFVICASPAYLGRAGVPRTPADLATHECLGFMHWRRYQGWRLEGAESGPHPVPQSRLVCNHGPALRTAALAGLGLVLQPLILLSDDIAAGRLIVVLEDTAPPPMPVHLIYPRDRQQLPKVRSFVEFVRHRFGASLGGAAASA